MNFLPTGSTRRSPRQWVDGRFCRQPHARRLVRAYGRRVERFLEDAKSMDDLGPSFAGDLTGAEVRYMMENEWARNADDVLWRRSKIGLKATADDRAALDRFITSLNGKMAPNRGLT